MGDFNERNYNDGYGQNRGNRDNYEKRDEIIFSRKVRAGKRTYFFDVKTTRANDYFITLSESKKSFDGHVQKSKVFLYKEDVNKFMEGLNEVVAHMKQELLPDYDFDEFRNNQEEQYNNSQENNGSADGGFTPPGQEPSSEAPSDQSW